MRILLTNDDGIDAPGLGALHEAIADLGEIHVVAPAKVQSATSHSVTFHRPIRVIEREMATFAGKAVEGWPADCVKLALTELVPQPVDLCISGMNAGANVGINVIYSGTVAAAREAAFIGVPAVAMSLHLGDGEHIDWPRAAAHARRTLDHVLAGPIQPHTVVNVNVPILDRGTEPAGVKTVPISTSPVVMEYAKQGVDEGHTYEVSNPMTFHRMDPDTDVDALFAGYITLTPLHFELTHHEQLQSWRNHFEARSPR